MAIATATHGIVREAGVGVGAGAEVTRGSEDGAGPWKDGRRRPERGAILHLLPPPMTSGKRLLTLLLMKFVLSSRKLEITRMKIWWPRKMIKRWVETDHVHCSPTPSPDPFLTRPLQLTHFISDPTTNVIVNTYYGACTTSIYVQVDC